MEIVIKNKGKETQKCVLFSYYDRCFKAQKAKNDFLKLDTGVEQIIDGVLTLNDDIEISIDGDSSEEKRLEFLKSLQQEPFSFDHIELHVNDNSNCYNFRIMYVDANGHHYIYYVYSQNYLNPQQESLYPIKIDFESRNHLLSKEFRKEINQNTAYLFHVKPNQEWRLKFIK